jgi:hypothetical protein
MSDDTKQGASFNVVLAADRQSVTLGLTIKGQEVGSAAMTAEELSGFIDLLGRVRQAMADEGSKADRPKKAAKPRLQ